MTAIPLETNYQFSVLPDTLYRTSAITTGLSQTGNVALLVDDTETLGTIFGSFERPSNPPNGMYAISTNVSGLFIFDYVPTYMFFDSLSGGNILVSSLSPEQDVAMPLNKSILFVDVFGALAIDGLISGPQTFPLSRTSDGSGEDWSLRFIFKNAGTVPSQFGSFTSYSPSFGFPQITLQFDTVSVQVFVYGELADRIEFDPLDFSLLTDRWYQMVVTFDGGSTANPTAAGNALRFYLTDLSTNITNELSPISNNISFSGSLLVDDFSLLGSQQNIAIMDIWDGVPLTLQDVKNLSNFMQVDPFLYETESGATLFKGWAMGNITADISPFSFDYKFFRSNNETTDPNNTYRMEATDQINVVFDQDGPA